MAVPSTYASWKHRWMFAVLLFGGYATSASRFEPTQAPDDNSLIRRAIAELDESVVDEILRRSDFFARDAHPEPEAEADAEAETLPGNIETAQLSDRILKRTETQNTAPPASPNAGRSTPPAGGTGLATLPRIGIPVNKTPLAGCHGINCYSTGGGLRSPPGNGIKQRDLASTPKAPNGPAQPSNGPSGSSADRPRGAPRAQSGSPSGPRRKRLAGCRGINCGSSRGLTNLYALSNTDVMKRNEKDPEKSATPAGNDESPMAPPMSLADIGPNKQRPKRKCKGKKGSCKHSGKPAASTASHNIKKRNDGQSSQAGPQKSKKTVHHGGSKPGHSPSKNSKKQSGPGKQPKGLLAKIRGVDFDKADLRGLHFPKPESACAGTAEACNGPFKPTPFMPTPIAKRDEGVQLRPPPPGFSWSGKRLETGPSRAVSEGGQKKEGTAKGQHSKGKDKDKELGWRTALMGYD